MKNLGVVLEEHCPPILQTPGEPLRPEVAFLRGAVAASLRERVADSRWERWFLFSPKKKKAILKIRKPRHPIPTPKKMEWEDTSSSIHPLGCMHEEVSVNSISGDDEDWEERFPNFLDSLVQLFCIFWRKRAKFPNLDHRMIFRSKIAKFWWVEFQKSKFAKNHFCCQMQLPSDMLRNDYFPSFDENEQNFEIWTSGWYSAQKMLILIGRMPKVNICEKSRFLPSKGTALRHAHKRQFRIFWRKRAKFRNLDLRVIFSSKNGKFWWVECQKSIFTKNHDFDDGGGGSE